MISVAMIKTISLVMKKVIIVTIVCFDVLMDEYLTPEGGWIDQYDSTGKPMAHNMPASTGYHVVLAMAELMRIMDA